MTDIRDLVSRLDVDQKIGQIQGVMPMDLVDFSKLTDPVGDPPDLSKGYPYDIDRLPLVRPHGVGHLSLGQQFTPDLAELRRALERFQDVARDLSPFGIGVLVHAEGVSGFVHPQGYQFTTPWGQAATWDPSVSRRIGEIAAQQARAVGIHLFFSPVLDLARDIRWGRVHETYGEDAELVTRMGIGFIRGVQDDAGDGGILATGKHFLGYGTSVGALNQASTQLGRRELVDVHAEPFRRAIAEAGLSVIMNSYNDIDGVPAAANRWLLTDLLRGQLGFHGLVVSDYGALSMLHQTYRTAPDAGHAAAQALEAGLDVELPSGTTTSNLRPLIEDGTISEVVLDRAVTNVLEIKAQLGLVPHIRPAHPRHSSVRVSKAAAAQHGRATAEASITLLANDGILPLAAGTARVAVVGPAADEIRVHFGAYSTVSEAEMAHSLYLIANGQLPGVSGAPDVLPDLFQTPLPGIEPIFEELARDLHPEATTVAEAVRAIDPASQYLALGSLKADAPSIDVKAVSQALADLDVVIAVVGERTGWTGNNTSGEGRTTANPALSGNQEEFIKAVRAAGKPVVTVVVSGRPLLLEAVHEASAAVVLAPLLGPAAGPAIADVLFGVTEPGGRTPSTFPRHGGQIPMYHGHPLGSGHDHPTLPRHGYVDLKDSSPLYPFGHGLTYTSFDLALTDVTVTADTLHARAAVRNVGKRTGTSVVQLYVRDEEATVVRPVRQLVDFGRITLAAGVSEDVDFVVPLRRLAYTWPDGRRGLEAGQVTLLLGRSSADICDQRTVDVPQIVLA
ncbi:glycoside hydrolase family 3 N-terminal domain-containing protein [Terrabacter sp. MAHUQ-38]|uniref:glycoside hydrolase family 3 N-terminal domain-containing protein n=1 Tax=unclassified Terrabacter TaxID=2630222 RepID=UPI00165E2225|nr:glycoside hydrolase family 3 N-terminal domain-containing protein [Terrabacter sp. MAHUQ-38]MBC9822881.1 glycoside hydrolase family 3 C-terminal domain-containing protein [Terrabacter sp. MAHUQ-38]